MHAIPLYAPRNYAENHPPSVAWDPIDFSNVDDTVRGGSSSSSVQLVNQSKTFLHGGQDGELIFQGYLDTLTLGGAGFASQLYFKPLPINVTTQDFKGLSVSVRSPQTNDSNETNNPPPGGGENPVTSFVLGFKTELPTQNPEGSNQSSIVYEWDFQLPNKTSSTSTSVLDSNESKEILHFENEWKDFIPVYRGRPVEPRPEFKPEEIKEWSIMARSDFAEQSGPFSLQLVSISALPTSSSNFSLEKRSMDAGNDFSNSAFKFNRNAGSSSVYCGFSLLIFVALIWFL